jgi:hypothetical protein
MAIPLGIFQAFKKNKKGETKVTKNTTTNNYAAPTAAATPAIGSEEERRKKLQQANVLGTSSSDTQEGGLL